MKADVSGQRKTAYNSTFAIGGVSYSAYSFVVIESLYLQINISVKLPAIANPRNVNNNPNPNKQATHLNQTKFHEPPKLSKNYRQTKRPNTASNGGKTGM